MSVLISLSPNVQFDDLKRTLRTLLLVWQWRVPEPVTQVEEWLSGYLHQPVVTASSGRAALAVLLRAFGIGPGAEVIVQAFTCVSVPAAVQWAGATPIFADIRRDTYNLDPSSVAARITPRTKAIVVQHTFGLPADWTPWQVLARQHSLVLIEDVAHALGARSDGRPVGTLGDAAFFSFGRDKILSCVFGGAISTRNQLVLERVRREQENLPYPPAWWVAQQLLHPLLIAIVKPLYFFGGIGQVLLYGLQRLHLLSKALLPVERDLHAPAHAGWRFSPALAYLLLKQLKKLDQYTNIRASHAAAYQAAGLPSPPLPPGAQPGWLRFPLTVKNPAQILRRAKRHRLLLGDWYRQPVFPVNTLAAIYNPNSCPVAEAAATSTINLPTMPTLSAPQREHVLNFLRQEKLL